MSLLRAVVAVAKTVPAIRPAAKQVMKPMARAATTVTYPVAVPARSQQVKDSCGVDFRVDTTGDQTRESLKIAINTVKALEARGARGIDSDGVGLKADVPIEFFQKEFPDLDLKRDPDTLRPNFRVASMVLPRDKKDTEALLESDDVKAQFSDPKTRETIKEKLKKEANYFGSQSAIIDRYQTLLEEEGLKIEDSRKVPVSVGRSKEDPDKFILGPIGLDIYLKTERSQFIIKRPEGMTDESFNRHCLRAKLRLEQDPLVQGNPHFDFDSTLERVIYKGIVPEKTFEEHYDDLQSPHFKISEHTGHTRHGTNKPANLGGPQPFGYIAENGENTADASLRQFLISDPTIKEFLGVETINIDGWSDSKIKNMFVEIRIAMGAEPLDVISSLVLRANSTEDEAQRLVNETMGNISTSGPVFSGATFGSSLTLQKDIMEKRPGRGSIRTGETVHVGSEPTKEDAKLGRKVFDPEPGTTFTVRRSTGQVTQYRPPAAKQAWYQDVIAAQTKLPFSPTAKDLDASHSDHILRDAKTLGLNQETKKTHVQPMLRGKDLVVSMANQAPGHELLNATVNELFHVHMAQATAPVGDDSDRDYISLNVHLGQKFHPLKMDGSLDPGLILETPFLTPGQLDKAKALLPSVTLNTSVTLTGDAYSDFQNYQSQMKTLLQEALQAAVDKKRLIVFDTLSTQDNQVSIPLAFVVGRVDNALRWNGLRHETSLVADTAEHKVIDLTKLAMVGLEAAVFRPFFSTPLIEDLAPNKEPLSSVNTAFNTANGLLNENIRATGRETQTQIIGSRTGNFNYIGSKISNEMGLAPGMPGPITEFDLFQNVTTTALRSDEGEGDYLWEGQEPSTPSFAPPLVQNARALAAGKIDSQTYVDVSKAHTTQPHKYVDISTVQRPFVIGLIGGGPASHEFASAVLENPNVKVLMLSDTKTPYGKGIAGIYPPHAGRLEGLHRRYIENFQSDQVKHVLAKVGVKSTDDLTASQLSEYVDLIVDGSGAQGPITLNVPGKEHFKPVEALYGNYTGADWEVADVTKWPLNPKSRNQEVVVVGGGKVSWDAALSLTDPAEFLETSSMNPYFIQNRQHHEKSMVHLIYRSGREIKIDVPDFMEAEARDTTVRFITHGNALSEAKEHEDPEAVEAKNKYIQDREGLKDLPEGQKVIVVHLYANTQKIEEMGDDFVYTYQVGEQEKKIITSDVIRAIGYTNDTASDHRAIGQRDNSGIGALPVSTSSGEAGAKEVLDMIESKGLPTKPLKPLAGPEAPKWITHNPLPNSSFINLTRYWREVGPVLNQEMYEKAIHFGSGSEVAVEEKGYKKEEVASITAEVPLPKKDEISIYVVKEEGEGTLLTGAPKSGETALDFAERMGGSDIVNADCDSGKTCGTCTMFTADPPERGKKERGTDEANSEASFLSCFHPAEDLLGKIIIVDRSRTS